MPSRSGNVSKPTFTVRRFWDGEPMQRAARRIVLCGRHIPDYRVVRNGSKLRRISRHRSPPRRSTLRMAHLIWRVHDAAGRRAFCTARHAYKRHNGFMERAQDAIVANRNRLGGSRR